MKHPTFEGERLLVVQLETATGGPDGEPILAFDRLGARRGDLVLLTNDGAALQEHAGADHPGAVERDGASGRSSLNERSVR